MISFDSTNYVNLISVQFEHKRFVGKVMTYTIDLDYLSLSLCLSLYLSLSLSLSLYLSLSLSVSLYIYLSLSLSISIFLSLSLYVIQGTI